ncbi:hypothetical protein M4A07_001534 [Enterococcus faecalis]|nr:hypothetical protein [Enterococcus faecalis]EJE4058796.1 hypothetical protein [Enterococcus faecalis]NSU39350.1 hypothetical protein [Enterococcus faecalis]NSV13397.1 hypothetical protein [Enterococcus faecalis]
MNKKRKKAVVSLSELLEVSFYPKALPQVAKRATIFGPLSEQELVEQWQQKQSFARLDERTIMPEKLLQQSASKSYLIIRCLGVTLDPKILLEKLQHLFPLFIWTKGQAETSDTENCYFCEFIPICSNAAQPCNLEASLQQMNYPTTQSLVEIVNEWLNNVRQIEQASVTGTYYQQASLPQQVGRQSKIKTKEEQQIQFLQESLRQEKAAKARMKVAKEKAEQELLRLEKELLASSWAHFVEQQTKELEEEEWYDLVKIDLFYYDELSKKAKFLKEAWEINQQLLKVFPQKEGTTFLPELAHHGRWASLTDQVSELEIKTLYEQGVLIKERMKLTQGSWLTKPRVKLYQIDLEQLERIGTLFDLLQTENRLIEIALAHP